MTVQFPIVDHISLDPSWLEHKSTFVFMHEAPAMAKPRDLTAYNQKLLRLVAGAISLEERGRSHTTSDLRGTHSFSSTLPLHHVAVKAMGYGSPWWAVFHLPTLLSETLNGLLDIYVRLRTLPLELAVRKAELEARQAAWQAQVKEAKDQLRNDDFMVWEQRRDTTTVKARARSKGTALSPTGQMALIRLQVDQDAKSLLPGSRSALYAGEAPSDIGDILQNMSQMTSDLWAVLGDDAKD